MFEDINLILVIGGAVLGLLFGVVMQRSRLCLVAAVANWVLIRDWRQLHGYLAAVCVALIGTLVLELGGWVAVAESAYRTPSLDWLNRVLGGIAFGFGSVLAGGCASRTLVRSAQGNLGAMIALMGFALAAMAALFGALQPVRGYLGGVSVELAGGDGAVATQLGLPLWAPSLALAATGLGLLFIGRSRDHGLLLGGALVGLLVAGGWWLTGYLAVDEFDPRAPVSISVSGPLARASLTLVSPSHPDLAFGVPLAAGMLLGALVSAVVSREFHWIAPQPEQVGPNLLGGLMMGAGAIFAGGCNIGNSMTGVSTAAVGPLLATAAIFAGMLLGLAWVSRRERLRDSGPQRSVAFAHSEKS
ncbi:MAG: YeeE/YedE family protein [Pseudomonadota bacterium]|nr:YeeE/YedE family protein [Pseudomonadota bacterium]